MLNSLISLLTFIAPIFNLGHFLLKEKLSKANFPVCICINNKLNFFFSSIKSFTILLFGFGSSLYNFWPQIFLFHLSFYLANVFLPKAVAFTKTSSFTNGIYTIVEPVWSFLVPPLLDFFNLYPVVFFAALLDSLLLAMPIYANTQ